MKLLSFAVPSYNSEEYLGRCLDSLVIGGDEVEVIVVNDGSGDGTEEVGKLYEKKYPGIVRVVSQENGGHGEAVNTGLKHAAGVYFKVVDSDDKVDPKAYKKILAVLRSLNEQERDVDMMLSNFVYDKQGAAHKKVMSYRHAVPKNRVFSWDDKLTFKIGQYILMHSVIYRTEMLRESGMVLPKHTFYVDNIFVFQPLVYVKTAYYLDVNFYLYYIGREDQSVNEKVMIKRIDQQIKVNKIMIDTYDGYLRDGRFESRYLEKYMFNYLDIIMCISSIMSILSEDDEVLAKKAELWQYLQEKNPQLYEKLRHTVYGIVMNLPGRIGRRISVLGYRIAQKVVGFN